MKGRLDSLKPNPQMQTTGLPFCRAYADDAVCAAIFVVQSVLISDWKVSQSVTSYMM